MKVQDLQMASINVLQHFELKQRDLFERKDLVQNDGTNDPYKHFLIHQYLKFLTTALELRYASILQTTDQALQKKLCDGYVESLSSYVRLFKRSHGLKTFAETPITVLNFNTIFKLIPEEIFQLRVPLFMDIQLLQCTEDYRRQTTESVSLRKDQDFMARI